MSKYHELIESRLKPRGNDADRWGAAIAGTVLFALPTAGGLYRGSFGWMEAVVAVTGIAGLAVAADAFMRHRPRS